MPLNTCPDCGAPTSPTADACPKCGRPSGAKAAQNIGKAIMGLGCLILVLPILIIMLLIGWNILF